ncbi:UPF0481 protein At3g47200-like [Rosa rugosa]|uniref:UPF0481 protein At3g47200-like n=1 Tax=Rosa rugosa TaxID=74645 RepID=UPI002B40596A|nr:UPF0481 protein At3g47200-like [Rosa rugosa]
MGGSIVAAPTDTDNPYYTLETSIKKGLDSLTDLSPLRCIFRVPDRLRRVREEAYTPRVISIGPFHHGKKALKAMEDHKKRYLRRFMGRFNLELKDYIRKMKDQEAKLRSCYPESIELSSDDFVRIILVDAIFVIEFLLRNSKVAFRDENDCIFGKPRMIEDVLPDLLILENQLPFFILKDLFDPDIFKVPSECFNRPDDFVERLSIGFLYNVVLVGGTASRGMSFEVLLKKICSSKEEVQHFVDLLRKLWLASLSNKPPATLVETQEVAPRLIKRKTAPTIEKLHQAGVKFEVGSTTNLFDIQFKDGILKIPKLKTGDSTELKLRNLIAFEQCSTTSDDYYISDYVSLMDELVDTPKDVELLVKYEIVENDLGGGDHELSSLINSLSTGIIYDSKNFYYGEICGNLDKFIRSKWHKRMAILRRNYFNTPWATISFVAAVVLIIFTAIQTICSIISLK